MRRSCERPLQCEMLGGVAEWSYQLIVRGELGDQLESAFHGMRLTRTAGNTVLTGTVRDQAALHGLLERVSDFGLTLLEVRALDHRTDPQARMQMGTDRVLPALAGREPTMATGVRSTASSRKHPGGSRRRGRWMASDGG
jgi:hypothetical protein